MDGQHFVGFSIITCTTSNTNFHTAIHGDKQQNERDWVLNEFKMGKSPIMVATDVASRGIGMISHPLACFSFAQPTPAPLTISYRVVRFMLCSLLLVRLSCRNYYTFVQSLLPRQHLARTSNGPTSDTLLADRKSYMMPTLDLSVLFHRRDTSHKTLASVARCLDGIATGIRRQHLNNSCIHNSIHHNTICYSELSIGLFLYDSDSFDFFSLGKLLRARFYGGLCRQAIQASFIQHACAIFNFARVVMTVLWTTH